MLRKIGFHRVNASETDRVHSSNSPERAPEASSEHSRDSPASELHIARYGEPQRSISNANSKFPGERDQGVKDHGPQVQEPLGLHLVHNVSDPAGDIIFVHGLGGTARKTWCWERNLDYFWPLWLADEDELSSYRIFTFGYNSNFKGACTNLNIVDFAKDLLFQMLTFTGESGGDHSRIGRRAIFFVAHSMGGLVVKKAYVLGRQDFEYADIISRVHGVAFLATPHRGAQYAKTLNNILSAAPFGASAKAYVAELDIHSGTLQDINEQFRTVCGELALVSFFETLKTNFGLTKILVVGKESGILGYPQEISSSLKADHHTICKFRNPEDANYISVRNILKLWASRIRPSRPNPLMNRSISNLDLVKQVGIILSIREPPKDELNAIRNKVTQGTGVWLTERQDYTDWVGKSQKSPGSKVFYLIGPPATGKSSLAAVVIDHLQYLRKDCQYHFFTSSHQAKRTVAFCLRTIAFQLALINEEFREKLLQLHEETGVIFTAQDQNFDAIWEKIYEGIVLRMRFTDTLFWVLDAVDEADSPSMLISHLMRIQSFTPIKFFFTSRPMKMPSVFTANNSSVTTCVLTELDTLHDIRTYVHSVVRDALPDDEQIQEDIIDQVLTKASGSFLWVKLALETLQDSWHTQDDIRKALTEVPKGMEQLYEKMLGMIEAQSPRLRLMATRILTWAACCWRPLSIAELHVALEPEFKGFLKLQDTIVQICGHFISVENSKISLVHLTARHFLLHDRDDIPAFVQSKSGHEHIAGVCLRHLSNDKWRRVFKVVEKSKSLGNKNLRINRLVIVEKNHPFLGYATCYWAYHVSKSSVKSQDLLAILQTFFTQYSLLWIEAIALSGNLRYLIRSAQYLKAFTKRMLQKPISDPLESPLSLKEPPEDEAKGIQTWANDFIRIAGKFGPNLVQSPSSIHRLVAPFCPPSSMIGKMYRDMEDKKLSVAGLNSTAWDDCLASVSVEQDEILSKVLATDMYFITLISSGGVIIIWHAETCEEARRINHKEYVPLMALNRSQTCLATAGLHTYRIWDISSGKELYCIPKLAQALTMALEFGKTESEVVVGLDDCTITCYDLETAQISWCFTAQNSETESFGCPRIMALNSDMSKVAMAWRGKPPLVWDITTVESQEPEQCKIHDNYDALCAPEMIQWQTDGNSILILCQNTTLVEWHLYDEDQVEFHHTKAREMTISRDGNFLLTSDNMGTISVWTFPRLCLIYKLINENELIRDLAFSPDGQRFYDIRESRCNIWEPDALVRPEEHEMEDQSSIGEVSVTTEPVISHDESSQSRVTSLATHFEDKYYCCGREDGTVVIHEAFQGKKIRKVYSHASTSSVVILAWSRSGRYIISADDSGRVVAKRLEVKEAGKWGVYPVFDFRMTETVVQILFNHDENMVLISTFSTDLVWGLKEKRELCRRQWVSHQGRRWVEHPLNAELLIWIDAAGGVHTYKWTTLKYSDTTMPSPVASVKPTPVLCGMQASTRAGTHERLVQWISLTRDKRYLVYETLPNTTHTSTRSSDGLHLEFLSIMDLVVYHPHALESECMADLAGQVQRLIGTFEDTVVFLDQDYWLSSWKINTGVNEVKRHFFLPKDWLNASTLHMAALNSQGTFFCPKHGDVAIVRNGMTL